MGYRIHYSHLEDDTLSAVVSGKSTLAAAGCIARDIAAQAARESARQVLIDLRWLEDRIGMRALLGSARPARRGARRRRRTTRYYVFSERERADVFRAARAPR